MPRTTRRSTRKCKPVVESSNEENVPTSPTAQRTTRLSQQTITDKNDSSSESDIESYLKPANQIDLSSSFFNVDKRSENVFQAIESNIFAGVNRLSSDSDSEDESTDKPWTSSTNKLNFQQLYDYTKKIEKAKQVVEKYEARKRRKINKDKHTESSSISDLLAKGEAKVEESLQSLHSSDYESFSDSEKEWEEVEEQQLNNRESIVPKEGVQITVELPGVIRKKKGIDLIASMKRRLNRIRKETQVYVHKVHLLCWIAHGNYVNTVLNSEHLLAMAMSLLPSQHCYPPQRTDLSYLEAVVKWFSNFMPVTDKIMSKNLSLNKALRLQINRKHAYNKKMLVYIFICMLRALGIQCRLVLSFVVAPIRPPAEELHSLSSKTTSTTPNKSPKDQTSKPQKNLKNSNGESKTNTKNENQAMKSTNKIESSNKKRNVETQSQSNQKQKNNETKLIDKKEQTHKIRHSNKPNLKNLKDDKQKISKCDRQSKSVKTLKIPQVDGGNDIDTKPKETTRKPNLKKLSQETDPCTSRKHPTRLKKPVPQKKLNLERLNRSQHDVRNDIITIIKGQMAAKRNLEQSKLVKRKSYKDTDYDSDYAPEPNKKKQHDSDDDFYEETKVKVKRRIPVKQDENKEDKNKKGIDIWAEVYLESEEQWISVDINKGRVHCVKQLYSRATHPISYIVAWNNNNTIKDITQRYCPNWNTVTRKLRIDKKWWATSLKPFTGMKTVRDREEDEELARMQLEQPLPKSINEYKDHPLYVLKRHLLKFQAIYPPDSVTLGFVREEPVYSRDCVHTLHSRETWLKHAKVVKLGETPYKVVKARPKYDKLSGQVITDLPLEVFGKWQTEDYVPPTAKDGIVPRNAYGNVELFKACMLPKGTVHLQLPGLNKLAKKMNIDCVPAVVGFDIHSGWTHPTFDGFVVCEEFSECLIAAWYLEQEEREKRDQEKTEKRVYDNWKKLIKGLLIRERLKARYDYGAPSQVDSKNKKRKAKGPKFVAKKRRICSESESD